MLRKQAFDDEASAPLREEAPAAGAGRGLAAPSAAPVAPSPAPAAKKARAPESPVARADRLFAERRWTEAAVAFRDLLRDDPRNPDAARWRQRLAACEAASAPARPIAVAAILVLLTLRSIV